MGDERTLSEVIEELRERLADEPAAGIVTIPRDDMERLVDAAERAEDLDAENERLKGALKGALRELRR